MNTMEYKLNLNPGMGIPPTVRISQGDIGRHLVFAIYDGASLAVIPTGSTAIITGVKRSGLGFTENCTISGANISIDTTEAMAQESGNVITEIRITSGQTNVGTANFNIVIEPAAHPAGTTDGTTAEARTVLERCENYAQEAEEAAAEVPAHVAELVEEEIADEIATVNQAIALKADQATTYTKTEVDALIDEVEVETDTTLEIAGAPADAKTVGDELTEIKADLDAVEGSIGDATAAIKVLPTADLSGSLIHISDGTEDLAFNSLTVEIPIMQSGSGDPSPENIRAFNSPLTSIHVYVSPTQNVEDATTYTIDLTKSVYKGTVDVLNGKLTETSKHKILTGSGSEGVSLYTGKRFRISAPNFKSPAASTLTTIKSNILKTISKGAISDTNYYKISQSDSGSAEMLMVAGSTINTVALMNAWLAEHNVEIDYPVTTPIETTLEATPVKMLSGDNYIWSDEGCIVSLSYNRGVEAMLNGIQADQLAFITEQARTNVFNPNDADIITNATIEPSDTIGRSTTEFNVSGYIPCEAGKSYIFPVYTAHFGTGSSVKNISFYDSSKNFLSNISGTLVTSSGASSSSGYFLKVSVSSSSTAKYFRVNFCNKDVNNSNIQTVFHTKSNFMVLEGTSMPQSYKFYPYAQQQTIDVNVYSGHEALNNPLYGKNACFLGDSICEGDSEGGWAGRIGRNNTMMWRNQGIGGSTISTALPSKTICTRDVGMNNAANIDYIIFEGGTNDADHIGNATGETKPAAFGTWSESEYGTDDASTHYGFDISTYCGAVDYMCKRLVSLYPSAKIGFIGAHKMGTTDSTRANRGYYIKTAMEICKKWGIPVLDLWNGSHLNPKIPSHYTSGETYLYADGQHLTANGYEYITPKIEAWMKTL